MRNICTEAGMFAIRAERDYVVEEDFMKAARHLGDFGTHAVVWCDVIWWFVCGHGSVQETSDT